MNELEIETSFDDLISSLKSKKRKSFLRDIHGQIMEDENLLEIFTSPTRLDQYLILTTDKKKNDTKFVPAYLDLFLVIIDKLNGGSGILKPVHQTRVIKWNRSKIDLKNTLRKLTKLNRKIRLRRFLILNYGDATVGYKQDKQVYMK